MHALGALDRDFGHRRDRRLGVGGEHDLVGHARRFVVGGAEVTGGHCQRFEVVTDTFVVVSAETGVELALELAVVLDVAVVVVRFFDPPVRERVERDQRGSSRTPGRPSRRRSDRDPRCHSAPWSNRSGVARSNRPSCRVTSREQVRRSSAWCSARRSRSDRSRWLDRRHPVRLSWTPCARTRCRRAGRRRFVAGGAGTGDEGERDEHRTGGHELQRRGRGEAIGAIRRAVAA